MLEVKNLSVSYSCTEKQEFRKILNQVSFSVHKGEVVVLTGTSGSGKSTLLKTLCGIIPSVIPAEVQGEILLSGEDLGTLDITQRSEHVSTVFQNPKTQFFAANTLDELAFGLENRNLPRQEILQRIRSYSALMETTEFLDRDIFKLSGGEKQLVATTAAACMENEVYVFDEPSSALDTEAIGRLGKLISILKNMGKIVIVAEHRLYYLRDCMDRLLVLENGTLHSYEKDIVCPKIMQTHQLRTWERISKDSLHPVPKNLFSRGLYGDVQILCEHYCLNYQDQAVFDMDLSFGPGIHFIIGQNGVGKSSFIRAFAGLYKGKKECRFRGKTYWNGQKIRDPSNRLFLVMQEVDYQLFTESVAAEMETVCGNTEKNKAVLQDFGLLEHWEAHPQSLSGGEKQRLLLALSVASGKPIVILDEPTSGLCKRNMLRITDYLHRMAEEGKTIIVVTHDYEFIQTCGGEVIEFIRTSCQTQSKPARNRKHASFFS